MYQTNGRFLAEVKIKNYVSYKWKVLSWGKDKKTMYHTNGRFLAEVKIKNYVSYKWKVLSWGKDKKLCIIQMEGS